MYLALEGSVYIGSNCEEEACTPILSLGFSESFTEHASCYWQLLCWGINKRCFDWRWFDDFACWWDCFGWLWWMVMMDVHVRTAYVMTLVWCSESQIWFDASILLFWSQGQAMASNNEILLISSMIKKQMIHWWYLNQDGCWYSHEINEESTYHVDT